jgi:hypothetical protein
MAPLRPIVLAACTFALVAACAQPEVAPAQPTWIPLFNGEDLDGWTPKFSGFELGDNYKNTFRVEDGLLRVAYDEWESFGGEFGHLFFATPFSNYRLRVEYRFVGDQLENGPGWAFRNNGMMLHCQSPESMELDQDFPASIEAQMLGGDGTNARTNGNLCTPSTHVVMKGELEKRHCINSTSNTYHGDEWVTIELEVRGHEIIRHWLDGEVVLEYTEPQLDEGDVYAQSLMAAGSPKQLSGGYISLQAETHPIDFRSIEVLSLD